MSFELFVKPYSDISSICFAGKKFRYSKTHNRNTMLQPINTYFPNLIISKNVFRIVRALNDI
jgi:hypothetical protein